MTLELVLLTFGIIILLLFLDHYRIHGYFYDQKDFSDAIYYLGKSHEGLIVTIVIGIVGIIIGALAVD